MGYNPTDLYSKLTKELDSFFAIWIHTNIRAYIKYNKVIFYYTKIGIH